MKKNYLFIILASTIQFSLAQIVNIPDANFKNALISSNCVDTNNDFIADSDADTNDDGEIQQSEADAVTFLDVNSRSINSLDGIAAFGNLQFLNCNVNNLMTLDVSQNVSLVQLECRSNSLANLDITSNTNIGLLDANFNSLTTLTVGANTNLSRIFCSGNNLSSINLLQVPNLTRLSANNNQFQTINVSNNTLLEDLFLQGNQFITINLSSNTSLNWLDITSNDLVSLDLSNNPMLETLSCAFNDLTILDLTNNTSLVTVFCPGNLLTGLDIQNGTNTSINLFNATNNPNLTCINVDDATYSQSQSSWTKDATASYDTNCPALSTDEFQEVVAISMFPNPTNGKLQIESKQTLSQILVYNLVGQQVKVFKMQAGQNSIDISELKTGGYFVNVQSTTGNMHTKLIVKK